METENLTMDTANTGADMEAFMEGIQADTETPAPQDVRAVDKPEPVSEEVSTETPKDEKPSSDTPAEPKAETAPKTEDTKAPDPEAEAEKQRSKYAKEMARREQSWKKLADEKAAFEKSRAEIESQKQELARQKQEFEVSRQTPQYSVEDYEKAATKFEADGKFDLAEEARAAAKDLRDNPPDVRARAATERQQFVAENAKAWNEVKGDKRLAPLADKDGAFQKEALKLFPWVGEDHQGNHPIWKVAAAPRFIAEFMANKLESARVPELEKSLADAKSQIAELKKLTAVPVGGSVHSKSTPKSVADMTDAEAEDAVLAMAAQGESIFGGRGF
jgi:hypothetical protein